MKKILSMCMLVSLVAVFGACEKMDAVQQQESLGGTTLSEAPADLGGEATVPGTAATVVVGETPFTVEIASTDAERAQGLKNRESLPEGNGMWFVFPASGEYPFYMEDTNIPLDLIYVSEDDAVVAVLENRAAGDATPFAPDVPFLYVLEVNAGDVAAHGIKVGDAVQVRVGPTEMTAE